MSNEDVDVSQDDEVDYNFTWNHRVLKTTYELEGTLYEDFHIVEVQYRDGAPSSYCDPFVSADSLEQLEKVLDQMRSAFFKPLLTAEDFADMGEEDDDA